MAIKILQIDLQHDITPQIGSYDNAGGVTPNNWLNEDGVYSLGPTNVDGRTPYYWFTPTREVTDFDLCWEDYQDREQTTPQYHLEIGDSTGNVVLSAFRQHANYYIGPVNAGDPAYQTWHKILVEVRKASASSSTVTIYFDGKKVATGTSGTLLTSAKIALLGHVPNIGYMQNAGQRLRYVTIYDRSYTSKGINLDGMMTTITALISKLIAKLSTVALTGSYNDLSDKPTISTVNNGTLTIQKNGTNVATFTANQSTNATANIVVPTAVSELTNDSGYLTASSNLDASKLTSGTVDIARLPQGALERLVKVANEAARYALTTADVQLGDTVQQLDTGIMYVVTDTDHLDSAAGYTEYTAGTAASVPWSGVTGKPTFAAVATSGAYSDLTGTPTIPAVNDATLTIQKNGTDVATFSANSSTNATANITVPTKTSDLTNDSGFITSDNTKIPLAGSNQISGSLIPATDNSIDIGSSTKNLKMLYTKGITIDGAQFSPSDLTLESLSTNSIPFHNAYPRCKYLGTTITDAQNTAIKNRTYDDLFIGDYWTINGVNWRIVAIDYYYNVGDTNFDKGNIIVMPDTVLYDAQMNTTDTTAGAYYGSLMRTQNLNSARTIAQNAFGSHLANHRIVLANAVDSSGPSNWAWYDSDGVELPNEVQIYGTRVWGSALKGFDVATQKQQFPLLALAPQFVNIRQAYWLQDVSSCSVSRYFAYVCFDGIADNTYASNSLGVRPSVTLSYI